MRQIPLGAKGTFTLRTLMKSRHLADEIVSLPQTVEIAQGVDHGRTIERFIDGTPTFSSRLFAVSGL